MDKRVSTILLSIVVLILVAVNILIFKNNHKEEISENNEVSNTVENSIVNVKQETENKITSRIATLPEKNRMQIYFGDFLKYIEQEDYESAYDLLNESFKQNYFSTINEFKNYMEKYPKNITVNYQNIERQGELFVLTVEIKDVFDSSVEAINQRVVIRENDANNYTISFQVEGD